MGESNVGLRVSHYRAFGDEPQGFDRISPVNVIVGRNNSGKSSLIDLVESVAGTSSFGAKVNLQHSVGKRQAPAVHLTQSHASLMGGAIPGRSAEEWVRGRWPGLPVENWRTRAGKTAWPDFKEFWEPLVVSWTFGESASASVVSDVDPEARGTRDLDATAKRFLEDAARRNLPLREAVPLAGRSFYRIAAERSVLPEPLDTSSLTLSPNGAGATNVLNRFVNDAALPREVVEDRILGALNGVFEPDATFTSIEVQRLEDDRYELFLVERQKGAVPLSASGSGLQTVLLVLTALEALPRVPGANSDLREWAFAFEELENNLHPALQRRLFWMLRERAVAEGTVVFLTTHSPVVVDLFADDEHAQIIHVTHDGTEAVATPVLTHTNRRGVLDDLDVRASDLLQANAVVWVEGPTDRMYFNRWVELWTDGDLREGKDYQCVPYGGRLLNHLSAEEPGERQREAVEILRVNRNAVVLIDSDKRYLRDQINDSKKRLRDEVEAGGGVSWVTAGKEVEQYVPRPVFESLFGPGIAELEPFGDVLDYLNGVEEKPDRKRYDKIRLAESLIPLMTRGHLEDHLDLASRLDTVVGKIREWNRRPAPPPREVDE